MTAGEKSAELGRGGAGWDWNAQQTVPGACLSIFLQKMSTRYFLLARSHAHFCTVSPLSVVALADLPTFCATVAHEDSGSIILRLHYFKVKEAQSLVWVFLGKSLAFQFLQAKFPKPVKEYKHLKKGQSRRKFTISCLRKKSCPSTRTPPPVRGVNGLGT